MPRKMVPFAVLALILASLFSFAGCGSADQESYFREVRELNERVASRLEELGGEAAGVPQGDEEERREELAEILEEMALVLEEGALELSRVKVPVGGEDAHRSLLEVLSGAAAGYRESAAALLPHAAEEGEHAHEGNVEEGDEEHGEESVEGHESGEGAEEAHPSEVHGDELETVSGH